MPGNWTEIDCFKNTMPIKMHRKNHKKKSKERKKERKKEIKDTELSSTW